MHLDELFLKVNEMKKHIYSALDNNMEAMDLVNKGREYG